MSLTQFASLATSTLGAPFASIKSSVECVETTQPSENGLELIPSRQFVGHSCPPDAWLNGGSHALKRIKRRLERSKHAAFRRTIVAANPVCRTQMLIISYEGRMVIVVTRLAIASLAQMQLFLVG